MRRAIMVVTVLAALAAPAAAQRMPDFAILDRGDGFSNIGLDVAFLSLDSPPLDSALRIEPHAQLVTQSGLGAYGAFPIARSFGERDDTTGEIDGETAIGDLDVGGLYVISGVDLSFVFRLGLVVPTASEDNGDFVTNYFAGQYRLTDIAMVNPDAWYARLAFSPLLHMHSVFLRVDLGVDIPFAEDNYRADPIGRLNVGGGVDLGAAALMLELATIADIDDDDEDPDDDEDLYHTVAVTARFMGESLQPFLSIGMPIDEPIRDRVDFFIAGGIQGVIR